MMGDNYHTSPPSYGFNPQAPPMAQPQQIVYTTTPAMVMAVGPHSTRMTCPSCNASIYTRVEKESTTKTHLIALLFCVFLMCPCAIIPYCCDCGKNTNHYCPQCRAFLGTYTS